ncbi:MAG TPA: apolipoprotein N-acyltransferase [Bdellovibrionota bacterium]|nr:apolipoprotein N-acyltransferase [Bdellovibrionota bacterium]
MRKRIALPSSILLTALSYPLALYTPNLAPAWVSSVVVWFALVPLLLSLHRATPGESFRWGYIYGLFANGAALFWIIIAMRKYGNLSWLLSGSILFSLIAELAFYPAVTFWTMARLRNFAPAWLVGALSFTLLEWTRVYMPLEGYPWITPAYGLYGDSCLIQIVEWTGVAGLNLLIFTFSFSLADSLTRKEERRLSAIPALVAVGAMIAAGHLYGFIRLRTFDSVSTVDSSVRVSLIQANIPQDSKWQSASRSQIFEKYGRLTAAAVARDSDLIVWPEAAFPLTVASSTSAFPILRETLGEADLVLGAATWERAGDRELYRNSAFIVGPDARVKLRYDKRHLVPFGEYVPFSDILPTQKFVPAVAGNFVKGGVPILATVPRRPDARYGILICYEVLFPDLAVDLVRGGANFLVNITNDAWFDETSGPYQHVEFGRFRAIETRRPIVRAANTGVTAWFDARGNIHDTTSLFTEGLVTTDIHPRREMTFYVRHPQFIPHVAAMILLIAGLGFFRRRS